MKDRVPANPNRFLITPEDGSPPFYGTLTRADNPIQEGTLLDKASLLKDATAVLYGLTANAVPDDVLAAIKPMIDRAYSNIGADMTYGQYTGDGTNNKGIAVAKNCRICFIVNRHEVTEYPSTKVTVCQIDVINTKWGYSMQITQNGSTAMDSRNYISSYKITPYTSTIYGVPNAAGVVYYFVSFGK